MNTEHRITEYRKPMLALILLLSGCGYTLGYRAPPSIQSIAIPIFNNVTFPLRRELEYDLTSALRKQIQSRTALELTDSDRADMVVYGTISRFRNPVLAENPLDIEIESTVVIEVTLVVEDYVNARRWTENVVTQEPLSVQSGETLDEAVRRAINNLAEKILGQLGAWDVS